MDQDSIADPRKGEAVRLIHPAADSSWIAVYLGGKRLKIHIVGKITGKLCPALASTLA